MENRVSAWDLFVSHLLWKEIVSSLEIHIPFGKADQISADSKFGSGEILSVFAMWAHFLRTHYSVLAQDAIKAVPSTTKL